MQTDPNPEDFHTLNDVFSWFSSEQRRRDFTLRERELIRKDVYHALRRVLHSHPGLLKETPQPTGSSRSNGSSEENHWGEHESRKQTVSSHLVGLEQIIAEHIWQHGPKRVFQTYDPRQTGVLSLSKFRKALNTTLNITLKDEDFEELSRRWDENGDGYINYKEFMNSIKNRDRLVCSSAMLAHPAALVENESQPVSSSRVPWAPLDLPADEAWRSDMNLIHSKLARRTAHTRRLFLEMNLDRVGNVSLDELWKGLNYHGIHLSKERVAELSQIDKASNPGTLTYDEFLRFVRDCSGQRDYSDMMPNGDNIQRYYVRGAVGASPFRSATSFPPKTPLSELVKHIAAGFVAKGQLMREVFRSFDSNDDGFVTRMDLLEGMAQRFKLLFTKKQVDMIFAEFDSKGDGYLQYSDFVRIVQSGRSWPG